MFRASIKSRSKSSGLDERSLYNARYRGSTSNFSHRKGEGPLHHVFRAMTEEILPITARIQEDKKSEPMGNRSVDARVNE